MREFWDSLIFLVGCVILAVLACVMCPREPGGGLLFLTWPHGARANDRGVSSKGQLGSSFCQIGDERWSGRYCGCPLPWAEFLVTFGDCRFPSVEILCPGASPPMSDGEIWASGHPGVPACLSLVGWLHQMQFDLVNKRLVQPLWPP